MRKVVFIDIEVTNDTNHIVDIGAVNTNKEFFHDASIDAFMEFIADADYLCGHNIIEHDLKYLPVKEKKVIDTLYWSPLLFPKKAYHSLPKDEKLLTEEFNNPVNDAKKARDLFYNEVETFNNLPDPIKQIYYSLLNNHSEFSGFFSFLGFQEQKINLVKEIKNFFHNKICNNVDLREIINDYPVELAYTLGLINKDDEYLITPKWVIRQFPKVENLLYQLRGKPCNSCEYCKEKLDIKKALKYYFNYDDFRKFDGKPLQEEVVKAAVNNKSLLAIFPTGGGKSLAFQLPALIDGNNTRGLTVVITPLQSLMKDQVDNLEKKQITEAVTINGLLNPVERKEAIMRVKEGRACILYIAPESLRSKSIERLLLGRRISRIVIDEAHCFSSWGQDFRVDYLFIADFINNLKEKKQLDYIPVSCFTATAKPNVINDIKEYFRKNLNIELEVFETKSRRKNLEYKVIQKDETEKYRALRDLLETKNCPTIIYVARTKKAQEIAERLNSDGYNARYYHGQMDSDEKIKSQNDFMRGKVNIMVATSAFGMGVDKEDVGLVIHYDISDSLENYIQEAGRAGRDQNITADCYVLFDEEDLNKHFMLLNQTKITIQEIQQVWKAIKDATKIRSRISQSALEIAREAGWDDNKRDIETRVKTAIAALENAGYVKRGFNSPRIYANSIHAHNMMEVNEKIEKSEIFDDKEKEIAKIIMQKLISSRRRKYALGDIGESRVDYIADDLGLEKEKVVHIIGKLREANLLDDAKDLIAYIEQNNTLQKAMKILYDYMEVEKILVLEIPSTDTIINLKELNELADTKANGQVNLKMIKRIINFWATKNIIKRVKITDNRIKVQFTDDKVKIKQKIERRFDIAEFILERLEELHDFNTKEIAFSVIKLMHEYNNRLAVNKVTLDEIEEAILYLTKISALKIEGGFLVIYNSLSIERLVKDNKIRYKLEDYQKLRDFYQQKMEMIHIVGEYAKKMMKNHKDALIFVDDYFKLEYSSFIRKYFNGPKGEVIKRNITNEKFNRLFGQLSEQQLKIINDKSSQYIVVAAGPGSGKTRILVHKLASLLLMEDVKHEQLLMLTFSRLAATEFKKRLIDLIGKTTHFVDIKTFHSYCFDLLGRIGNIEDSVNVVKEATEKIENDEVEPSKITKTVLVIDEAQDMDEYEYRLIKALIDKNTDLRVIAVGDDDQNIYAFRGSDSKYMRKLLDLENAQKYELIDNFRSRANLTQFTNKFVETISTRLKKSMIMPRTMENGKIEIIEYKSENFIIPAIDKLVNEGIESSTCILTTTNEEALLVNTLLKQNNINTRLINSSNEIKLTNILEMRYFINELGITKDTYKIIDEKWEEAKISLKNKYSHSENYYLCNQLIKDFELVYKDKYVSDFQMFIKESNLEDFIDSTGNSTIVSTIHKAKGREYDNVIMIINNINIDDDENKRLIYVGMTRAKKNLTIHYNDNYLYFDTDIKNLIYRVNPFEYESPNIITIQLRYRDVYLSHFSKTQEYVKELISGDVLIVDERGCLDKNNNRVLLFSKEFKNIINEYKNKNYFLHQGIVKYIVYWKGETETEEILIVLPEIEFIKKEII